MSRLIDADALHKYMFKSASERMSLSVEYMGGWNDAINYIASQTPTVDAVPVVRGRWKCISVGRYACSLCGFEPYYAGNIGTLRYCPNCGSRNRSEE